MAQSAAIFVSKRLQRPAVALLCLMMMQTVLVVASCTPEPVAMGSAARVAILP